MEYLRKVAKVYRHFVSGFGFSLVVLICVGVITATAVWTKKQEQPYSLPETTPGKDMSAASVLQENLYSVSTPAPTATRSPIAWMPPLKNWNVVHPFSPDALVSTGIGGVWQTHDGIDLLAEPGEAVAAMGKGKVIDCGRNPLHGSWAEIDLGQGWTVMYAGMSMLAAIQPGDYVSAGQTVGFAGNGSNITAQQDFVHISVFCSENPVDPASLFDADE